MVQALSYDIDYLGNIKTTILDNPISSLQSLGTGSYTSGPLGSGDVLKFQNKLSPITYQILTDMGWLWSNLEERYDPAQFYNSVYLEYKGQEKFEIQANTEQ